MQVGWRGAVKTLAGIIKPGAPVSDYVPGVRSFIGPFSCINPPPRGRLGRPPFLDGPVMVQPPPGPAIITSPAVAFWLGLGVLASRRRVSPCPAFGAPLAACALPGGPRQAGTDRGVGYGLSDPPAGSAYPRRAARGLRSG